MYQEHGPVWRGMPFQSQLQQPGTHYLSSEFALAILCRHSNDILVQTVLTRDLCIVGRRALHKFRRFENAISGFVFIGKAKSPPYFHFRFIWPTDLETMPRDEQPITIIATKFEVDMIIWRACVLPTLLSFLMSLSHSTTCGRIATRIVALTPSMKNY